MTDKEDKNAQQQEPAPDADTHKEKDDITAQESSFNHAMKELGESREYVGTGQCALSRGAQQRDTFDQGRR